MSAPGATSRPSKTIGLYSCVTFVKDKALSEGYMTSKNPVQDCKFGGYKIVQLIS